MVGEEVAARAWFACVAVGRMSLLTRRAVHCRGRFVISVVIKQSHLDVARCRLVLHGSSYVLHVTTIVKLGDNK